LSQPYILVPAQGSDQADEWVRLGLESQMAGNLPLAQTRYQQALRLEPRHAIATQNLAIVFAQSSLLGEAILAIERATIFDDTRGIIWMNAALMYLEAERIDEALTAARRSVEIAPDEVPSLIALAMVLATAGMPDQALPLYDKILAKEPKHPSAGPNSCFIQTLTNATPADLRNTRRRWYAANKAENKRDNHHNNHDKNRTIRVGYVGGDFKSHSASFIFGRVLLNHTAAVEMYLYSTLPVDPVSDAATKRYQDAVGDRWRDISAKSDEDAAKLIQADHIDILVDLAGHTNGGRLPLFTMKPAPVQVTAWGFAHGTGCPEIDYFFADPIAVPESERKDFAEKIFDLPCIITFDPPTHYNLKAESLPPLRRNGYLTLGAYCRYEKMSDECIKTYAEILRRIPDAKLEFKDGAFRRPYSIRRILSLMPDISPDRLLFSVATSHSDHMLAFQMCDIFLDPFPHSGGAVSLEVLYMSVPSITLYGTQPSGRSMSSILTAMGRTDWIAKTPEEYVEKVVDLANRPKELADARKNLRKELLESPVVKNYVESVEKAYAEIWKRWCNG
jgi:predicted O-linked N-acetylglucosamine transferase (SPINDLY family)